MDAAFRVWGVATALAVLAVLITYGAWGALAWIIVLTPIVGCAEQWRDA